MYLRGIDTLGWGNVTKLFCLPSEKGSTLKEKEFTPNGERILSF